MAKDSSDGHVNEDVAAVARGVPASHRDASLRLSRVCSKIPTLMKSSWKKRAVLVLRWGIAVLGIAWVVSNISLRDHVLVLNTSKMRPDELPLAVPADEDAKTF